MEPYFIATLLCLSAMALCGTIKKAGPKLRDVRGLTVPACHSDYTRYGDWCYYESNRGYHYEYRKVPYSTAVEYCRMMGGDLASIHNYNENVFLNGYAPQGIIGLRHNGYEFVWSDGSAFDYTALDPNFENMIGYLGSCTMLGPTYWENSECDLTEWYYTCKMAPTLYPNSVCPDSSIIHTDSGALNSPGYPLHYVGSGEWCQYMIAAKNGLKVQITFTNIYLGGSSNGNDTLYIFEGFSTSSRIGILDRNSRGPLTFRTGSMNRMLLRFYSYSGNLGAWKASFSSFA